MLPRNLQSEGTAHANPSPPRPTLGGRIRIWPKRLRSLAVVDVIRKAHEVQAAGRCLGCSRRSKHHLACQSSSAALCPRCCQEAEQTRAVWTAIRIRSALVGPPVMASCKRLACSTRFTKHPKTTGHCTRNCLWMHRLGLHPWHPRVMTLPGSTRYTS